MSNCAPAPCRPALWRSCSRVERPGGTDMSTRASLEERFRSFQVDFPPRGLTIAERRWQYLVAAPALRPRSSCSAAHSAVPRSPSSRSGFSRASASSSRPTIPPSTRSPNSRRASRAPRSREGATRPCRRLWALSVVLSVYFLTSILFGFAGWRSRGNAGPLGGAPFMLSPLLVGMAALAQISVAIRCWQSRGLWMQQRVNGSSVTPVA